MTIFHKTKEKGQEPYKRSSEILLEIARNEKLEGNLSYQYILQALGDRAFGIALLFFSLPSVLPFSAMPGVSVIFSLPIAIFALQMIFARKTIWLPEYLGIRTISHAKVAKIIYRVVPYLVKLERLSKPRWPLMNCRTMEVINGITIFCLALLLMLPLPFSNLFLGTFIIIFSVGIVEKDGVLILVAYICFALYTSVVYFLILTTAKAIFF